MRGRPIWRGRGRSDPTPACGRVQSAWVASAGYKPKATTFKPFDQAAKIKWLWKKVGAAGGLVDSGDAALMLFVARTAGQRVADLKFLPTKEASNVIEALKAMLSRAERANRQAEEVAR